MREQLLGYLLEALDPEDRAALEQHLADDPALQAELDLLRASLHPLHADAGEFPPPPGLAKRTCAEVARRAEVTANTSPQGDRGPLQFLNPTRWRRWDWAVATAVLAASLLLLIPALQHSRSRSQLAACQDRLRQLWIAQVKYAQNHGGYFTAIPTTGKLAVNGTYTVQLRDAGLLPDETIVLCPAAMNDHDADFRIPTRAEIAAATGEELAEIHRKMGGNFGVHFGYVSQGKLQTPRDERRTQVVLMADAPSLDLPHHQSTNHGGCGQNVVFGSGQIQWLTSCHLCVQGDEIYCNRSGQMAPGTDPDDSVIGHSSQIPVVFVNGGD